MDKKYKKKGFPRSLKFNDVGHANDLDWRPCISLGLSDGHLTPSHGLFF